MTPVLVLLGSNIEPHRHIPQAQGELQNLLVNCRFSRLFLTEPVGDPQQPPFWNAAAKGHTQLSVEALQRELARLENLHGRVRDPKRPCGPRTLDLDLLLYDQTVGHFGSLELPSPLLESQAFVLVPSADVAPDWLHPVLQKPLAELAAAIDARGVTPLPSHVYA